MNELDAKDCIGCHFFTSAIYDEHGDIPDRPEIAGRLRVEFTAGEELFEEGKPIAGIHCVHSGCVTIVKRAANEELVVAVVSPGDILGVPDIVAGEVHQNGARAIEDITICFIPKAKALELFEKDPGIMLGIMRKVCERIQSMERHAELEMARARRD
jgi:CRP-like cAMP-binding protein